jgi:hypothetical protein
MTDPDREHRQRMAAIAAGLDDLAADLDRIAASRAWRLGHGAATLLRRVARRPARTAGAVEAARARVEEIRRVAGLAAPSRALVVDVPAAAGGFVLFLGPGVEPLDPGWLHELVAVADRGAAAVAGTVLDAGGAVRHAAVRFDADGAPYEADAGRAPDELADREAPAASSAALLVRRDALERTGGIPDGYRTPLGGVDLTLSLGGVVVSARARFAARGDAGGDAEDRRLLAARWGARLRRRERPDEPLSFCLRIAPPTREAAGGGGDLPFAEALARELERRGHRCLVQPRSEWEDEAGFAYDVSVVVRGRGRAYPRPGQLNVLWSISHPEELTVAECDAYDLVAVASEPHAAELRAATRTPVIVLEQATDPAVFFPDPPPGAGGHDLVFVGNSRGVQRRILADLGSTGLSLGLYGRGWDAAVAEHVPNERLREVYSSGAIVLNDHWDGMRARGYVSNRLYDAVACGAFVISDRVSGLEERFGGAVVSYETPEELRELVRHFHERPDERAARGAAGRELVLAGHTFAHRADTLLRAVENVNTGH